MFKRWYLAPVFAIALMIGIVGCGGGDDAGSSAAEPAAAATTVPQAKPTATEPPAASIEDGKTEFIGCSACHGADAKGITGLGKDLVGSEFVNSQSDADLIAFIKVGRDTSDPANTTGVAMPPKGGNPALSDGDIQAIIAYLRSLK